MASAATKGDMDINTGHLVDPVCKNSLYSANMPLLNASPPINANK
jgi:hypothetical protein